MADTLRFAIRRVTPIVRSVPEPFDAIVVGSGACGGWAAKELTERGLRVALLEAGPLLPPEGETLPAEPDPRLRRPIQSRSYVFGEATAHLFVDDVDNPYSQPEGKPFDWIRGRQVGGRLHVWAGMSLRMSDRELEAAGIDGVGEDWPISESDLAPYYDRVERFLRVRWSSRLSPGERALAAAVEHRWPTRRVTAPRIALAPPDAMLKTALGTGRLTLRPDSVVSRVLVSGSRADRVRGVAFVDRSTGIEEEVEGRAVVLCASTIESTRLLLNSATPDHPHGLANSSGLLGRYLMDHTFGVGVDGVAAQRPRSRGRQASHGAAIPAFRNVTEGGVDFLRSYTTRLQVGAPVAGRLDRLHSLGRRSPAPFWMRAFGEVLPRFENRVTVDPDRLDAWGIPIAHVECAYGENERRMAADQAGCLREMAEAAGFEVERVHAEPATPGSSAHELGTARMGDDPANSVLDPFNRAWDVGNLVVADGSCFVSGGCQNPTLTMMALTVRACERLVAGLGRGEP
jgi:choline dehydrogenase-like flavoprotein